MAVKNSKMIRHVPNRMCVGCRQVLPKRSLIRIVKSPDGVFVDRTGKMNGRGAYLHDDLSCWEKGLKGPLSGALRTEFTEEDRQRMKEFAATLRPASMSEEAKA